ncbi:MAG: metallophosphoesterase [Pirellulaceae bacterium]
MVFGQVTRRDFAHILTSGVILALTTTEGEAEELPPARTGFSFGVVADAQYCDAEPGGTRYYRASAKKLADCVEAFNQLDLAFIIHLGDLIDRDTHSYEVMVPIYSRLKAPHYHVLGNHDFSVAADKVNEVAALLGMQDRYYH